MYKIFAVISAPLGEIEKLEYNDKDVANIVAKGLIDSGIPVITVVGDKLKVHNVTMNRQPIKVKANEWPGIAANEYRKHAIDKGYLGAAVYNMTYLGCFKLVQRWIDSSGMIRLQNTYITYKGEDLFSVLECS